jgi:hypothetical protein
VVRRYAFVCPTCGQRFELGLGAVMLRPHLAGKGIYVTCPGCRENHWIEAEAVDPSAPSSDGPLT